MTMQTEIPDDRELTPTERSLISWLLQHGYERAIDFLPQLNDARVTSRCYCGCASINFAINGKVPGIGPGITVLSDYEWSDPNGHLFGAFVFARCGLLAGLEIWSQDGLATANTLPQVEQLRPIGSEAKPVLDANVRSSISAGCVTLIVSSNP
jgi:hypothetical protein